MRLATWAVSALPSMFAGSITQKTRIEQIEQAASKGEAKPHSEACFMWATALKTLTGAHLLPLGEERGAGLDDIFCYWAVVIKTSTPAQLHRRVFYVPHYQPPRRPWRPCQKKEKRKKVRITGTTRERKEWCTDVKSLLQLSCLLCRVYDENIP